MLLKADIIKLKARQLFKDSKWIEWLQWYLEQQGMTLEEYILDNIRCDIVSNLDRVEMDRIGTLAGDRELKIPKKFQQFVFDIIREG